MPGTDETTLPSKTLRLEYEPRSDGFLPNVKITLARFIDDVNHLPIRIRDLLEIAGYIFCADRSFSRGRKDALEHHAWSRNLHFFIKVRDFDFWNRNDVKQSLSEILEFISGDEKYQFTFMPGRSNDIINLFDNETFLTEPKHPSIIALFSGGLDSLSGVVDALENSESHVYLISHRSQQPSTTRTQNKLVLALQNHYNSRVHHYKFYCSFSHARARDENQRTRSFLYCSIAYALSTSLKQNNFYVYENGVTAINFPKREDMGLARASRTTHPKTIHLLERFFSLMNGAVFNIHTPLLWSTKADILRSLETNRRPEFISSAVSCSKTFNNREQYTHCGECSQCIDRRLAAYAANLQNYDHSGLYTNDILTKQLTGEAKTTAIDFVRFASYYASCSIDDFHARMINELVDICSYLGLPEDETIEKIYSLHKRHGEEIEGAIKRMVDLHFDYSQALPEQSFLRLVMGYEHLKDPIERLVDEICSRLNKAIPITFQQVPPKNENDFNDKLSGILSSNHDELEREHPSIPFAHSKAIPDHSYDSHQIIIESKYIRKSTTPSKVTEGIAADLTKYPSDIYLLFVVYDPNNSISDRDKFRSDIENKRPRRCRVLTVF